MVKEDDLDELSFMFGGLEGCNDPDESGSLVGSAWAQFH